MKLLIIKTSSMGDVIHTLPALTDAQQAIPNLQVDWVVEKSFAEIPRWHSAVRNVIPLQIRAWRKRLFAKQTLQEWRAYTQQLRAEQYDAVIDAQGLLKSALCATRLAHGTKHGYDRSSAREGLSSLFYDQRYAIPYQQHAVERIRQLFAQSLGYTLPSQIGDYGIAHHFTQNQQASTANPYLVFIHSTTRSDKHWQEEAWLSLIKLATEQGLEVRLPWGNETEKARAERLATVSDRVVVLPKMSLTALASEIANAKAVVSVDTGLSHLTASLDVPNVVLYGATDPALIGAYGKNQRYIVAENMQNIRVQNVWDELVGSINLGKI